MQNLNKEDKALIEKIAGKIVERRLTVIAILFLEMGKPLSFIGSSLLAFLEPVLQSIISFEDIERFRIILEDRDNVEYLIQQIEKIDMEKEK